MDYGTNESRIRKNTMEKIVGVKSSAISIDDPSISYQIVVEPSIMQENGMNDLRATPQNIFQVP